MIFKMKEIRKFWLFLALVLCLSLLPAGQTVARADSYIDDLNDYMLSYVNSLLSEETEWAVCIYLCGSDLQTSAVLDLIEMMAAAPDMPEGMRLFVLTGGAKEWPGQDTFAEFIEGCGFDEYGVRANMFAYIPNQYVSLYEIRRDRKMVDWSELLYYWAVTGDAPKQVTDLTQFDEVLEDEDTLFAIKNDMSDPETAKKYFGFIDDVFEPEHMMLTFWNHGGGILYGVALDELNDDRCLSVENLRDILQDIYTRRGENKIDMVSFDACIMGSMEVAYTLSPYADYMLATEEIDPGFGWNYIWLRNLTYDIGADTNSAIVPTAQDIGKAVINSYPATELADPFTAHDEVAGLWQDMTLETLSLIDLSKLEDLYNDFENLAAAMLAFDNEDEAYHFAEFSRIAKASPGSKTSLYLVDLYEFAYNLTNSFNDETSALYQHLADNRNGCQAKCQALAAAAAAVVADFGDGSIERAGVAGVDAYPGSVVSYRGKGINAATGGLSFSLPQIGESGYEYQTQQSISVYKDLDILREYRHFLYAMIAGDNNARRFMGVMQMSTENIDGLDWDVMRIVPEAAGQSVASVDARLEYVNLQTGQRYVLGEQNLADADWATNEFKHYFSENWYAFNGNICSLNVEKLLVQEYAGSTDDVFASDEYIVYFFEIPGILNGEPVMLLAEAKQYDENLALGDVYALGYYEADRSIEQGAGRLFVLGYPNGSGDYQFAPVLAGDMNDCTTWEPLPEVRLRSSDDFKLNLGMQQLKSGDYNLYNGYFVLTDLTGAEIKSDPIPFAVINNLRELTVMPIPPQLYSGQEIEPYILLLFMGQEALENGVDYLVEYSNNREPGLASVLITAIHDGVIDPNDTLELSFLITTEDKHDIEYVNWLIDQLPAEHLPGEEFNDGVIATLNSPADEYVVHSLQAEQAKKAYELLSAAQRSQIAPERVQKLNEHYQAATRNIITKAEGASEIFGAVELMYSYNNDMPAASQRGTFMMTFGLSADADAETKANLDAALAAARRENSRVTTAQIYNPYFEQNVSLYEAAQMIMESLGNIDDNEPGSAQMKEFLQGILNQLLGQNEEAGVEGQVTQSLLLTGSPEQFGLNVVLKLEVPSGYNLNTMSVYCIEAGGQRRIQDVRFITENGRQYVIFQTDLLYEECYYALFAEAASTSSDDGGSDGDGGTVSGRPGSTSTPGSTTSGAITAANIASVFADVQNNAWYSAAIAYVYNNGMMNGTENGFEPNSTTTRAMLVTMLFRLAADDSPTAGASSFSDVPAGQWFSDAVAWAAANGVVNGYEDGRFAPNEAITREQLAVILWRYAGSPQASAQLNFADAAQVSDWAAEAVQWAVSAGVINGNTDNTLAPGSTATRAEVAQMLMNYLTK